MIEAIDLHKSYGDLEAVKGVSFKAEPGGVLGLLGPNGAGKTTIMKVLTGYHLPSSGKALIDGIDVAADPVEAKRRLGYLPENAPVYSDLSVDEYLAFAAEARLVPKAARKAAIERCVHACGLESVYYRRIDELSKGFRQRVGLAQAIVHDPSVLILDEPTNGLDPNQILEIRALIAGLGAEKTVMLSTHILQEAEASCSRVLILNEGSIAAEGSPETIASGLRSETRVTVGIRGVSGEAALAAIKALPRVASAKLLAESGSAARVEALVSGDPDDFAAAASAWASGSGRAIVELAHERVSLEDIFVRLTSDQGRDA